MTRNKFGGTPLQSKHKFVMESKTADLYAETWNTIMTKKDKQDIAKQLNIKIDNKAIDKDFANFDGNQADMVMDIVGKYLEQNECNESRPDFAQYQQLWKQLSIADKQSIAKELKQDKFNQFDVDLSKLSNDDYDIADDIITVWLAKHQPLNESADLYLYQQAYALNVDEGWLKWIVGMVTLRFLWKKVTKKFKNKIMKIAGVPESLWSRFNNQDLDSLPIAYKDKVSHALTANYDGSVNESLNAELQQLFEFVNESAQLVTTPNGVGFVQGYGDTATQYKSLESKFGKADNVANFDLNDKLGWAYVTYQTGKKLLVKSTEVQIAESVQESWCNEAWQLLDCHFTKPVNESWDYKKDCPLNRAMDFVTSATYASKFKQSVQSKFGVKFEADFRTGDALKAFNELSESQQNEFLKMLGMIDESNECDEDVAEVFNSSSIDHRTHILSSIGVPYADIDAMLSMEYQQLPEETRLAIAKHITNKDEVYEQDGVVYTNAGKESVIKKLDTGKYGIVGNNNKLWDAQYDTLKEAAEALKAYHVNESHKPWGLIKAGDIANTPTGKATVLGTGSTFSAYKALVEKHGNAINEDRMQLNNPAGWIFVEFADGHKLLYATSDATVDESKYDKVRDPWNHWNPKTVEERKALAKAANVGVLDYTEEFIYLPLQTQAKIAEYLDKQKKAGKLDESEESLDYVDAEDARERKTRMQHLIDMWSNIDLKTRRQILKDSNAGTDENDVSFDEYDKQEREKILAYMSQHMSDLLPIDETKLEDAYHKFIVDESAKDVQAIFDMYFEKADWQTYQQQFENGDIWFRPKKGIGYGLYHIKKGNSMFVKDMWVIYSKGQYSDPVRDSDNMPYQNDNMNTLEQVLSFVLVSLSNEMPKIKFDKSKLVLESVELDETKLEDAYHDFIDKKLKDWFDKKTIGELSNEEKKIFFGRIKRTWPKKKKELGFVD